MLPLLIAFTIAFMFVVRFRVLGVSLYFGFLFSTTKVQKSIDFDLRFLTFDP